MERHEWRAWTPKMMTKIEGNKEGSHEEEE